MDYLNQILIFLLAALLSSPFIIAVLQKHKVDFFSAPIMLCLAMFIEYVYVFPRFVMGTDAFTTRWENHFTHFEDSLRWAIIWVILALVGFFAGYHGPGFLQTRPQKRGHALDVKAFVWDKRRLIRLGTGFTAAGLAMFAVGVSLIGGWDVLTHGLADRVRVFEGLNYFFYALNLLPVTSLIWWTYLLCKGRPGSATFWVYTLFAVAAVSLQGNKSTLFVFALALTALYHYLHRRLTLTQLGMGGVILVLVLTCYQLLFREYLVLGELRTVDTSTITPGLVYDVVDVEVQADLIQLQALTFLVDRMPQDLPFQYGKTYLSLVTMPIPRGLWPEKPIAATGTFTVAFWPDLLNAGTSLPPGLIGELYMNFGAPGCFVGMAVLGYSIRRLSRNALGCARHPLQITRYCVLVALIPHYIRGEIGVPTVMYATFAFPLWLAQHSGKRQRATLALQQ